jgi:hypothetical protein
MAGCAGAQAGTGATTTQEPDAGTAASAATAAATPVTLPSPSPSVPAGSTGAAADAASDPAAQPPADGEAPEPDPSSRPTLLLEAGGLGVVLDDTRIEHLPFGTSAGTVRTAVARLVGPLNTRRRTDCEQGVRTSSAVGGLELLFQGSRFVGWTDTGSAPDRLTTGDGIGVGITVAALRSSGTDVTLERRPGGGGEWTSGPGGLYGRTTSVSGKGRVTLVSSGETCLTD